jgi:hypothetical protein
MPRPENTTTKPAHYQGAPSYTEKRTPRGTKISHLHGCVKDAHSVRAIRERHSDGTVNFSVRQLPGT